MQVKIKKGCDRIGTKKGEVYEAEKYKYDPFGKVFLKEINSFEYIHNIDFLSLEDKLIFYKK